MKDLRVRSYFPFYVQWRFPSSGNSEAGEDAGYCRPFGLLGAAHLPFGESLAQRSPGLGGSLRPLLPRGSPSCPEPADCAPAGLPLGRGHRWQPRAGEALGRRGFVPHGPRSLRGSGRVTRRFLVCR